VEQKNRAMDLCRGEWLFNLDADEEMTAELRDGIRRVVDGDPGTIPSPPGAGHGGFRGAGSPDVYEVCRRTWYMGRWIRHGGWYPEYRERLSRREGVRWEGEAVHERLRGSGRPGRLRGDLLHRPYGSIADHARKIVLYSDLWARREKGRGRRASLFDLAARPAARFARMYLIKAGFLDGAAGLAAAIMGGWYAFMKYAKLRELQNRDEL
jgi:hypothetical protein